MGGSEIWADRGSELYPADGQNKCNCFVADMIDSSGALQIPRNGKGWPKLFAADWANPVANIEGWGVTHSPQAGDVMAYRQSSFYEGLGLRVRNSAHVGIYLGGDYAAATSSASNGTVLLGNRMFRSGYQTTYRTYLGTSFSKRYYE
jgi:hypothetical protein